MRIKPVSDQATVVLVGKFNPAIFQPFWFAKYGVLGETEAEAAKIEIVHPEVTQFETEKFRLLVQTERFSVATRDSIAVGARDLVLNTFSAHLKHTPITAMGLNRSVHFDTGSFEIRDRVGSKLAPKEPWGEWGTLIQETSKKPQSTGGMTTLSIKQFRHDDEPKGFVLTKIEPSALIPGATGIFMEVNNHYDLTEPDAKVTDASKMAAAIEKEWEKSMAHCEFVVDQIMTLVQSESAAMKQEKH